MKQNFDEREYKVVVAEVPKFNEQMRTLKEAVASKQTAEAAAAVEWSTLNEEVPKAVEAIQARVDSLKPAALPKDVTKEELATAKTELETVKTTWAEATAAASAGNTAEATEKGRSRSGEGRRAQEHARDERGSRERGLVGRVDRMVMAAPTPPSPHARNTASADRSGSLAVRLTTGPCG